MITDLTTIARYFALAYGDYLTNLEHSHTPAVEYTLAERRCYIEYRRTHTVLQDSGTWTQR